MTNPLARAKEIFIENLGSFDNMQESGCLREYLQYGVPAEVEYSWANEIIAQQFEEADSKRIRVSELISSVSFVVSNYGRYQEYKKLLAIKEMYLNGAGLFELNFYYDKLLGPIWSLPENSHIASGLKMEIVTEFEKMVAETIENIDSIPDKISGHIAQKYNLQTPKNASGKAKLDRISDEIESSRNLLVEEN